MHRALYRTLTSYVRVHEFGRMTVVLTGDIPAMWIRDSAVQVCEHTYLCGNACVNIHV